MTHGQAAEALLSNAVPAGGGVGHPARDKPSRLSKQTCLNQGVSSYVNYSI